jgi:hypothetical protein
MSKKSKIQYPVPFPKGQTRPGTKPNKAGTKLVCVQLQTLVDYEPMIEVKRASVTVANQLVAEGWNYVSKAAWKLYRVLSGG